MSGIIIRTPRQDLQRELKVHDELGTVLYNLRLYGVLTEAEYRRAEARLAKKVEALVAALDALPRGARHYP